MARDFVASSSHYLQHGAAAVSAVPLTLAAWVRCPSQTAAVSRKIITIYAVASANGFQLDLGTTGTVRAITTTTVTSRISATSGLIAADTWHHAAAVFASTTSRVAHLDGVAASPQTTNAVPSGMNRTTLGALDSAPSIGFFFDGLIAEAAVWGVALDDAEVAVLAAGASPLLVRPAALVACWPLLGRASPEPDIRGGKDLTVTGATVGDHCRVFLPAGPIALGRGAARLRASGEGGWLGYFEG